MGFSLTRGASAQNPDSGRSGVWRLALSWFLVVAFALQSYATQTHVHTSPIAQVPGSAASSQPTGDHEAIACPFCQAIATAGAFVGPAPVALSFPAVRAETQVLPAIVIGLSLRATGFSWRSRAPPQP